MLEHAANALSMRVKAVFPRAATGADRTPHHRDKESAYEEDCKEAIVRSSDHSQPHERRPDRCAGRKAVSDALGLRHRVRARHDDGKHDGTSDRRQYLPSDRVHLLRLLIAPRSE